MSQKTVHVLRTVVIVAVVILFVVGLFLHVHPLYLVAQQRVNSK